MVGVSALPACEAGLPVVVGKHAVGHVSLDMEPSAQEGQGVIAWQGQPHLWHRTGVDAQGLCARAQPLVLQFHVILLGTHGEHAMQPTPLDEGLLHNDLAGIVDRYGNIYTIAHAPSAGRVVAERTDDLPAHIAIALVERRESILVGIEPQRRGAMRQRPLGLHPIGDLATQVEPARVGIVLPGILCRGLRHLQEQRAEQCPLFRAYIIYHDLQR